MLIWLPNIKESVPDPGGGIRPVGMQVPLLLQCLLDLVVASRPVGMQVPLLLQYLLDPSATSHAQEMPRRFSENRRDISWARHMLSNRVFRMSHPKDSTRQDEVPRPVGMQVPLLLQCLLDLDLSSGPVGMQVPLLLQYLLDPSWIPTTM